MKHNRKITNETIRADRLKMLNSYGYKRRVKNTIEQIRRYLGYSSKNIISTKEIKDFAHFFAEEMKIESRRQDFRTESSVVSENTVPTDSIKY